MSAVELGYNINTKNDFDSLDVEALGDTFEVSRKTFSLEEEDKMITQKRLKELTDYNADTGIFTWNNKTGVGRPKARQGEACTNVNGNGYIRIGIDHKRYMAHKLAWLYVYGEMPKEVDHINHIRNDNRLCNLREITHQDNCKNMTVHPSNKSGVTGVSETRSGTYIARIMVEGKYLSLGTFKTKAEAIEARLNANVKYNYHENHGVRST